MSAICISVGGFGSAAAENLTRAGVITQVFFAEALRADMLADLPLVDTYFVALSQPAPTQLVDLGSAIASWRKRMIPIVYEHPEVIVGPLSGMRLGTCQGCIRIRRLQHSGNANTIQSLEHTYDRLQVNDQGGFSPVAPVIAACAAADLLRAVDQKPGLEGAEAATQYVTLNVLTQLIRRGKSVGVHGCMVCAADIDETTRSCRDLEGLVADLTLLPNTEQSAQIPTERQAQAN